VKIKVELEEQSAAALHSLVVHFRARIQDLSPEETAWLRDAELSLAGALRSVGWQPNPSGGGWVQMGGRRRR